MMQAQLARLPTWKQLAQAALGISFCSAAIVVLWIEVFWRRCL
jgi:ABC-type nickel/cobalt efflux system permease component RcnA